MRLPADDTSAQTHYLYGRYTIRTLARDGLTELEAAVSAVNDEVHRLGREVEDLDAPIEDAIADRDRIDGKLDETARLVRNRLAGLGVGMEKREPMISILPNGLAEYTEATLGEQLDRYGLLLSRLETHLAETDPIRVELAPRLERLLEDWQSAVSAVSAARQAQDAAKRRLQQSISRWETALHQVYGALVIQLGSRRQADGFFRRASRARQAATRGSPVEASC